MPDDRNEELLRLDYATPAPRKGSLAMMLAGTVSGTIAGILGVGMLYYGISGIVWLVSDWKVSDGGDVFGVAICNIIGAMSAFFAVRWIRSALKGSNRDP